MIINGKPQNESRPNLSDLNTLKVVNGLPFSIRNSLHLFPNDISEIQGNYVENSNVGPMTIDPDIIPFDCIKYNGVKEFSEFNSLLASLIANKYNQLYKNMNTFDYGKLSRSFSFIRELAGQNYRVWGSVFEIMNIFDNENTLKKYLNLLMEYLGLQYHNYEIISPFSKERYCRDFVPYSTINGKELKVHNLSIYHLNKTIILPNYAPNYGVCNSIISDMDFNPSRLFDFAINRNSKGLFPFIHPDYIIQYSYPNKKLSDSPVSFIAGTKQHNQPNFSLTATSYFGDGKNINQIVNPVFVPLVENKLSFKNNIEATKKLNNLIDTLYEVVKNNNKTTVAIS